MGYIRQEINALHLQNNIYVYIEHNKGIKYDDGIDGAKKEAEEYGRKWGDNIISNSLWNSYNSGYFDFYGGRIQITNSDNRSYDDTLEETMHSITIDGIRILNEKLVLESNRGMIVSYLNSIAVHGVDQFMVNYKKSMTEYKKTLESERSTIQLNLDSLNPDYKSNSNQYLTELRSINELLMKLISIIFILNIHMTLGLENEKAVEAYSQVLNLLS